MSQGSSNPKVTTVTDLTELTAFGEQRTASLTPYTGWTFAYNILSDIVTSVVTGAGVVSVSASRGKLESGAAINSSAKVYTKRALRYTPGVGGLARFTAVFETAGTAGNVRTIGIQNGTDGLSFGYDGTSFGILRRRNSVDTWVPQASWNMNTCPWLDKTKGNVYYINYQWLGYGAIRFGMEDPATGKLIIVHTINYANTSADVSILNSNLPVEMQSVNDGTCATNCVMYSPSAMGFAESNALTATHGPLDIPRQVGGSRNATTASTLLLVENQTTLNGVTNRIDLSLESINLTADGSKTANFSIIRNPTLGGAAPVYADVLLNESPVRYSTTAGITYTGGTVVWSSTLMKLDRLTEEIEHLRILISPGETFIVYVTSTANTDVDASVLWMEGV